MISLDSAMNRQLAEVACRIETQFKLVAILKVLPIAESTVHYWKRQFKNDDPDAPLRAAIRAIWEADKHYGVRSVYLKLRQQPAFKAINHKKVQRLMHEMRLKGVATISNHVSMIHPRDLKGNV